MTTYPGNPRHQAALAAIVAYYADDPRVLALCVFGSLGRGTWDQFSDLDLDVVIADGVDVDVEGELRRLCASLLAIGEVVALIKPNGIGEGDVVMESLLEFSIRYHPLHTTSPNVVDSLVLLGGQIDVQVIKDAGLANRRSPDSPPASSLDGFVRLALGVDTALQRRRFWGAEHLLQLMRGVLFELFARTRGGVRPVGFFQREADAALQQRIGATLPRHSLRSAQHALSRMLDIAEQDLGVVSNGQLELTRAQLLIIEQVRKRQASLQLPDTITIRE